MKEKLTVKEFPGLGRGVVAISTIKKGCLFHIADLIELNKSDSLLLQDTLLANYVYDLGRGKTGLALGFGSLFNHSEIPNVSYAVVKENKRKVIIYCSLKQIKAGDQLFIDYGYQP